MKIETIFLKNYRNFIFEKFELDPRLNIIVGSNAQGKTNLLESIFVSGFGKSFRTPNDSELINFSSDVADVKIIYESEGYTENITYRIGKSEKFFYQNRNKISKISDLLGNIKIVLFHPDDLRLIKDGPSERRLFLNREISQISRLYCKNMVEYNKTLKQRNKILSTGKNFDSLQIFDELLSDIGSQIVKKRIEFIEKISKYSEKLHTEIAEGKETLGIVYESSFGVSEDDSLNQIKSKFIAKLFSQRERDQKYRTTGVGPHRDDFEIVINGIKGRKFGSQGQQRTAALAIKLSEIEIIKEETGEYPVLLLDDVMSELDINRQKALIYALSSTQVIITTTDIGNLIDDYIDKSKIIRISGGKKVEE